MYNDNVIQIDEERNIFRNIVSLLCVLLLVVILLVVINMPSLMRFKQQVV